MRFGTFNFNQGRVAGLLPAAGRVVLVRDIYVTETDEQAWAEATPALLRFWETSLTNELRTDPLPIPAWLFPQGSG